MDRVHNVISGDRITRISMRYYGTEDKTGLIVDANPQLAGRPISLENLPTIYAGDILIIPDESENIINLAQKNIVQETVEAEENQVTIIVAGKHFSFFTEYKIIEEIDTFDSFNFSGPFDDTQKIYRESFRPLSYNSCAIYYGRDLIFNGIMIAPQSKSIIDSKTFSIVGYPLCGVLNDCPMPISKYPIEYINQNLEQIAHSMALPFGIPVEFQANPGNPFEKVAPEPEQKVLDFLSGLAMQRGILLSNNPQGALIGWRANIDGKPVASIKEGELPYLSCSPVTDPQNYYSHITGLSPTEDEKPAEKYTVENPHLIKRGILRPFTYIVHDAKDTDLQASVNAKAGRMFASSAPYMLTLQGHRNQDSNRWKKNTLISVYAPGAMIYHETKFLIKSVTISRNVDSGDTTVLTLVLPDAYAGIIPEIVPWEE